MLAGLTLLLAACARAPSKAGPTGPSAAPPREKGLGRYTPWTSWSRVWRWSCQMSGTALSPHGPGRPIRAPCRVYRVWWQDVQLPMEIEAAMLPKNSVILESEPVELDWASARWYIVEVYAAADSSPGSEPTPTVTAVETPMLIVIPHASERRPLGVYGSARHPGALLTLRSLLEQTVASATLLQ